MAIELNRPDIRREGVDVDEEDEDDEDDDVEAATGGSGLAPGIDDRLLLAPLDDVCVLTGGESGDVDGKLENALVCELVDPDDPLLDDVASNGDSALPLAVPPGDACFEGAEKALDENRLDDPLPLLTPCDGWDEGVAMPCVDDDDDDDDEGADGERCSTGLELVADLPFAFLLGSVALLGKGPPARFLLLSSPPPPLPWPLPPPLPLPPLLPPALNMGPPDAPISKDAKENSSTRFSDRASGTAGLKNVRRVRRLTHIVPATYRDDVTRRLSQTATQFTP